MGIRGVFFDLFGTLLCYGDMERAWTAWVETLRLTLAGLGPVIDREHLRACCEGFFSREEPDDRQGYPAGLTVYERRIARLVEELGLDPRDAQPTVLREAADRTAAAWQESITLDPDALPLLEQLRGRFSTALVSNFDHPPHVRRLLEETGLGPYLDVVTISGEVGIKKPDPRVFDGPLAQLGLRPDEVVFIGDAREDVEGAHAAGLASVRIVREGAGSRGPVSDYATCASARGRAQVPGRTIGGLRELAGLLVPGMATVDR
jgi:putative hydrolase of the HAD superfamily